MYGATVIEERAIWGILGFGVQGWVLVGTVEFLGGALGLQKGFFKLTQRLSEAADPALGG